MGPRQHCTVRRRPNERSPYSANRQRILSEAAVSSTSISSPIRAAIMESPQAGLPGTALASYEQTLDGLGCATAKSPIQCLRSIPGADLKTHLTQRNISFPPVVDRITQTPTFGLISSRNNLPIYPSSSDLMLMKPMSSLQ